MLGYKVAKSFGKRVVITLEIPEDAITNMKRKDIAKAETAKYRTMKAKVIKIEDSDGKTYNEAVSFNFDKNQVKYSLDEELVCHDFNMNLEETCSTGIHFFLSKSLAERYGLDSIENGVLTWYYANGKKDVDRTFVNGSKTQYDEWYENGNKHKEFKYLNEKQNGVQSVWYENGNKHQEWTCIDGVDQGVHRAWFENGKKNMEITMVDGKKHGDCYYWKDDGEKVTITFRHDERLYGVGCCIIT